MIWSEFQRRTGRWPHRRYGAAVLIAAVLAIGIGFAVPRLSSLQVLLTFGAVALSIVALIRPALVVLVLYSLVLASNSGLVTWDPLAHLGPINGSDVLLGLLLAVSIPAYLKQRQALKSSWLPRLEFAWAVLIVLIVVESARSPATTLSQQIYNVRFVEGYLFFFPSIAVLTSRTRFTQLAVLGIFLALAGTALSLAQSLYGLQPITTSPFYDHSSWDGTKQMVGGIARVNLPVSDWVVFVVLIISALSLLRFRWWYILAVGVLSLTIFVDFARSLWLAVAAALVVQVVLLLSLGRMRISRAFRVLAAPAALAIGLIVAPFVGFQGLGDAIFGRIDEGVLFFASDTGTWGARQANAAEAFRVWGQNLWWGVGTNYFDAIGLFIDLALPQTLLSVGLVGLAVVVYVCVVCCLAALSTLRKANSQAGLIPVVMALGVISELVVIIVYQQWVNPHLFAILGFATAGVIVASAGRTPDQKDNGELRRLVAAPVRLNRVASFSRRNGQPATTAVRVARPPGTRRMTGTRSR